MSTSEITTTKDPWRAFLTPADTTEFLTGWLAIATSRISGARQSLLLLRGDGGRFGLAAEFQSDDTLREDATDFAEALIRKPEPLIHARTDGSVFFGYPIEAGDSVQAILVLVLATRPDGPAMRRLMRDLHWSSGWIEARLWQGQAALGRAQADSALVMTGLMSAVEEHDRFDGAALALVNAIPEQTGFDGAALGMLRGNRIRLEALTRSAGFARRSDRTLAYEAAMDEVLSQTEIVAYPDRPDGRRTIDAAHRVLARELDTGAIISAPLMARGKVIGVLTLTRDRGADETITLSPDLIDETRLTAAALAPLLKAKHDARRLLSGRLFDLIRRGATAVLGRRPAIALAAVVAVLVLTLPWLIPAQLTLRADATLEGAVQRAVVAPIDGYIDQAPAKAGQRVTAGDLLARLDDRDIALEAAAARARLAEATQSLRQATAQGDRTAAAIAAADLAEARARADLAEARLARLAIEAPLSGLVVSGDLSQRIGAPVSAGDTLFEIAEDDSWRLMIDLSEYDLGLVEQGQTGRVVFPALAETPVPFEVRAIAAVSSPAEGENRFRVEAEVTDPPPGLRPGLKGTAKIAAGESSLARTLLRGTIDRARLLIWRIVP